MPPYRLAQLSDAQFQALEQMENRLGITLVAYEPICDAVRDSAAQSIATDAEENDLVMDALVDTYRTYDPHGADA
jgi:hypothetical protein